MSLVDTGEHMAACVDAVRGRVPLVHCISAAVSLNMVADGLLAVGARPLMTETPAEAPTMTAHSDALLVNMGTLSEAGARGIPASVDAAGRHDVPWVLDPTAVGLAPVRTRLAGELLQPGGSAPRVIRGNASEIVALAGVVDGDARFSGTGFTGRGADAGPVASDVVRAWASQLARRVGAVVVVSGVVDVVAAADGAFCEVAGGNELLTHVTGTGCLHGALIAACVGAGVEPWLAAVGASAWLARAAEIAAGEVAAAAIDTAAAASPPRGGPGSFRVALLDALYRVGTLYRVGGAGNERFDR